MHDHQSQIREFAERLGYSTGVLTDGTIVCEPRPDPTCCGICRAGAETHDATYPHGDNCADCGEPLDVLNRCQRVIQGEGLSFSLRFVCPEHYRNPIT